MAADDGHDGALTSIAFSPTGKQLVTGSEDRSVRIWDLVKGGQKTCFQRHRSSVGAVHFKKEDSVVSAGDGVYVFDSSTGKVQHHLPTPQETAICLATNSTGSLIAVGLRDNTGQRRGRVVLYDPAKKEKATEFSGPAQALGFLSDKKLVFATFHQLVVANLEENKTSLIHESKDLRAREGLYIVPSGVAFVEEASKVLFFDAGKNKVTKTLETGSAIAAIGVSPDQRTLVVADLRGGVRTFDLESGKVMQTLAGHQATVKCIAFSADGEYLATGSDDTTVLIWRMKVKK
jgi:WD40 repeat protein